MTRGNDLSVRPGQPAYRGRSWAPATWRTGQVRGLCPWCCRAGGSPCRITGPARAAWPCARWPGRLALAVARRAAWASCRRPGCAAAVSRSSSPGVPGDLAGCAAGIRRRPGTPARCLAARAWRRPASAAGARTVSRLMPATGSGPDAIHGPASDDRPVSPSRAAGRGMMPALPSPAPSPAMPGSGGAAPGIPRSCWHGLAGLALAGCQCPCGQPLVPTGIRDLFESFRISTSTRAPLRNRTVDLLLTMHADFVLSRRIKSVCRRPEG